MRLISEATMPAPWGGLLPCKVGKGQRHRPRREAALETTVQRVRPHPLTYNLITHNLAAKLQ